jgi:hypothetical protein
MRWLRHGTVSNSIFGCPTIAESPPEIVSKPSSGFAAVGCVLMSARSRRFSFSFTRRSSMNGCRSSSHQSSSFAFCDQTDVGFL